MGIGIVAVESEAAQCGTDESEVTLVGHLCSDDAGIVGVHVLGHLKLLLIAGQSQFLAGVVAKGLDVHVLDVLVEESHTHHTDALEVIVG